MSRLSLKHPYRTILGILVLVFLIILLSIGIILTLNRPPSAEDMAATAAALSSPTIPLAFTPTPFPTLPGVTDALLVCQREAGIEMNKRNLVGAVNISDDHLFLMTWVSHNWTVNDLDDALPGIIAGLDIALATWEKGCAVFDRVQINVWDRRGEKQVHRLAIQAKIDDLLQWREGKLTDKELILRLQVTQPQ